jgi:phosphoenolpyruvate synthase/pyruvate phosphate dikinase
MNRRDRCAHCLGSDLDQKTMTCRACGFHHSAPPDNILDFDPFATLDVEGVGELMRMAIERGRSARPDIKLGICGEHGGDPASVTFCHKVGIDYVSCSPYRVPIARLAAAQAALQEETAKKTLSDGKRRRSVRVSRPPARQRIRR